MSRAIRPVASLDELAEAFDVIGAQLPQRLTHADRRFAELARRFPEDRALMLVVEVGAASSAGHSPSGGTRAA